MKLQSIFPAVKRKIHGAWPPKSKKTIALVGAGFAVFCVVIVLGIMYVKDNRQKTADCVEIVPQAQQIFTQAPNNSKEIKKHYQELKPAAQTCKAKPGGVLARSSAEDNLNLLFFYRQMAITAYSFGDYNEGKSYADKALALNGKVDDRQRGGKTNTEQVKAEMEAIKNDKY